MSTGCDSPSNYSTIFPVHVLGAGSIGLLYASALHCAYHEMRGGGNKDALLGSSSSPVTLLMRSRHKQRLSRQQFDEARTDKCPQFSATVKILQPPRYDSNGNHVVAGRCDIPVELIDEVNATEDGAHNLSGDGQSPIRCLLLCTKANDAIPALNGVWDRLVASPMVPSPPPAKVIVLSNGALGIRGAICKHFEGQIAEKNRLLLNGGVKIVLATTTHGAYKTQSVGDSARDFEVTHAGEGATHCTDVGFVRACQSIGWKSSAVSDFDMSVMLWKKLAVNCVINPLTAIHGVKNGRLLDFEHMGQDVKVVTRHILEEVSRIALMEIESQFEEIRATAGGNGINDNDPRLQYERELSVPYLETFVFEVMSDTANNVSSMLQDIIAGRTTEVRFLNGYVASLGREKYGVECPCNVEMCRLVEDLMH